MGTEVKWEFRPGDKVQKTRGLDAHTEVMTVHGVTDDGRISVFSSMHSTETLLDAADFDPWPSPWSILEAPKVIEVAEKTLKVPEIEATPETTPMGSNFLDDLIAKAEQALKVQTGGNHYLKGTIQPIEFFHDNDIPFAEASAMKYIYRWKSKGGKQDLQKAIQICLQLIAMEDRKAIRKAAL